MFQSTVNGFGPHNGRCIQIVLLRRGLFWAFPEEFDVEEKAEPLDHPGQLGEGFDSLAIPPRRVHERVQRRGIFFPDLPAFVQENLALGRRVAVAG